MGKAKKGIGFIGVLLTYFAGISTGLVAAAALAAYINDLHLPFIESPTTRAPLPAGQEEEDGSSEEFLFRSLLQNDKEQVVPAQSPDTNPDTAPSSKPFVFYLQIGAFRDSEAAQTLRGQVALSGHNASIRSAAVGDGSTLYRVWLGPYDTEDEAEQIRAQLTLEGYQDVSLLQLANR